MKIEWSDDDCEAVARKMTARMLGDEPWQNYMQAAQWMLNDAAPIVLRRLADELEATP